MPTPEEMAATMRANVPEKTGQSLEHWFDVLQSAGLEKHGQMVKHLKADHGVTHGFANLIVSDYRALSDGGPADLVDAMYKGREALRPIHDRVMDRIAGLGTDVELAPKKAYVSLRRNKQFAMVGPATKTQVEVSFNLKGKETTDRLKKASGMATHKVRLASVDDVDDELVSWLEEAYAAG